MQKKSLINVFIVALLALASCGQNNKEFAKYDKIERVSFEKETLELPTNHHINPIFYVIEKETGIELDTLNYTFECSSADESVATYDNQTLSTIGIGTTFITLKLVAPNGYSQKNTFTTSLQVNVVEVDTLTALISVVYDLAITTNFSSLNLAFQWHNSFGTTLRETIRNDRVQEKQHNRNPFIDFPEFDEMCFDPSYSGSGAFI